MFLFHCNLEAKPSKALPGSRTSSCVSLLEAVCIAEQQRSHHTAFGSKVMLLELKTQPGARAIFGIAVGYSHHRTILKLKPCGACRPELQSSAALSPRLGGHCNVSRSFAFGHIFNKNLHLEAKPSPKMIGKCL